MRKYTIAFLFFVTLLLPNTIFAKSIFIPKEINFVKNTISTPTFNSGDKVNLNVLLGASLMSEDKTYVEYGVAREIVNGQLTEFEPIKTLLVEKAYGDISDKNIEIVIPNTLNLSSTSTYIFYVKSYEENNPDNGNFIVSEDNFHINPNNSESLTIVRFMNLLHSNGKRFDLLEGPTIYDLSKTKYSGVASSTSIEVTFESNTNTVLKPTITFKKLRSDIDVPDQAVKDIVIKKGINKVIIPLPTFDYVSGVYQGVLSLNNENIPDVDFQYIVAGDMVTFVQPTYSRSLTKNILNFEIYATPVDLYLDVGDISTSSDSVKLYQTEFILRDKNNIDLYSIKDTIDFSTSTYSLMIPSGIKNIEKVYIKTIDKDGKVLYEGTKDLDIVYSKISIITYVSSFLLIVLLIVIAWLIKRKRNLNKLVGASLIVFFSLLGLVAHAQYGSAIGTWAWGIPRTAPYLIEHSAYDWTRDSSFQNLAGNPVVGFSENITTKVYSSTQDTKLLVKVAYPYCVNSTASTGIGFSILSINEAKKNLVQLDTTTRGDRSGGSEVGNQTINTGQRTGHERYAITLVYKQVNIGKLKPGNNDLYIHNKSNWAAGSFFNSYKVPLKASEECPGSKTNIACGAGVDASVKWACKNGVWESTTAKCTTPVVAPTNITCPGTKTNISCGVGVSRSVTWTCANGSWASTTASCACSGTKTNILCGTGAEKSKTWYCLNNAWTYDEVACPITDCILDGVVMASGTSRTFYSSRISYTCEPGLIKCEAGSLIGDTSIYKYRACVGPDPSEF